MSFEVEPAIAADQVTDEPLAIELGEGGLLEAPWQRVRRRFFHNKAAMFGLAVIVLLLLVAAFAPLLAPYDPSATQTGPINQGPSAEHLLGTDSVGHDLLSQLVYAAQVSLEVAFLVVFLASLAALPLGLISGYFGRWIGGGIDWVMNALFTFPPLTLALVVSALLGPSLINSSIAIAIVFVPGIVRLLRSQVLAVREETFIEASRSVGVGSPRMLRKHVFPNTISPFIVQAALLMGYAIGAEAGLTFLGLGIQTPDVSWGTMLQGAYATINETQWPLVPPVVAILLAILAFNLVGDGLRDALGRESFRVGE